MKSIVVHLLIAMTILAIEARSSDKRYGECFMEIFSVQSFMDDNPDVRVDRKLWKRGVIKNAKSLEVTGASEMACCFRIYSKYHHKGASCIVRAGDKFADLMSTGMTRVASAHIVPPKNCETMYDDDNLDNCS